MSRLPIRFAAVIILFFSFLLFLSGYILQQQSLHALEKAIAPTPIPTPPLPPKLRPNKFTTQTSTSSSSSSSSSSSHENPLPLPNTKLAYLQSVNTKTSVCHALMLFADLQRFGSSATRILYYPATWDRSTSETYSRLLRAAERRYSVLLRPLQAVNEKTVATAAFRETAYKRVVWLDSVGTLLQSLDELMLELPPAVVAKPRGAEGRFWILEPGVEDARLVEGFKGGKEVLEGLYEKHTLLLPPRPWMVNIKEFRVGEHGAYLRPGQKWDPEEVRDEVAYVSFWDSKAPMPWMGVEAGLKPKGKDGEVWWELYRTWERVRGEVCGLDLEPRKAGS